VFQLVQSQAQKHTHNPINHLKELPHPIILVPSFKLRIRYRKVYKLLITINKMKKIGSYAIDEDLIKKINKLSKKKRLSASWIVNESIIHYLNKKEVR